MDARFELRHSPLGRIAAIAGPTLVFLLFAGLTSHGTTPPESAAAVMAVLLAGSMLHAWFVLGGHYEVTMSDLHIVHGPWHRRIPLGDVLAALPLRTLDRGPVVQLRLAYGRQLLLTPLDRTAFLDALEAHTPHLEVHAVEAATRAAS